MLLRCTDALYKNKMKEQMVIVNNSQSNAFIEGSFSVTLQNIVQNIVLY